MTHNQEPTDSRAPLSLSDLFAGYLERQTAAQAAGVGYAEPADEAVPHDAVPVQPVDPQLAWHDALAVARHLATPNGRACAVPPDWPALVNNQEPAIALAFCLGNFPQLVRNLHILLSEEPAALRVGPTVPAPVEGTADLLAWAARAQDYPQVLLTAGALRLARHFDRAEELLRPAPPAAWAAAHANEVAALAWHRGQTEKALELWQAQPASVPVLFNRGMAALFLGQSGAREALSQAVAGLPETSAWHHLGQLYLALANARAS